jgi:hypothetical protein
MGYLGWAVPASDGGSGGPALVQTLIQFICGYRDVDLRDSTGLGHGRLIARHAAEGRYPLSATPGPSASDRDTFLTGTALAT